MKGVIAVILGYIFCLTCFFFVIEIVDKRRESDESADDDLKEKQAVQDGEVQNGEEGAGKMFCYLINLGEKMV